MNTTTLLNTLSHGPALEIKRYKGYYLNGYYFDIRQGDDVSAINTEDIFQEEQCPPVLVDPTHDIDIVEEGVYVILKDDDDDVEQSSNEGRYYESDYPNEDYDYEQVYWGTDIGDDNDSSEDN
ncbi:hypothetical protein LIER_25484 [Lithospermum erythrorhizon]|uniref:Uncharacterized protein n=1 Tax=Lithospermum erythrorhizon TaxID=34254 RepID=A0AAV3R6G6_LITER